MKLDDYLSTMLIRVGNSDSSVDDMLRRLVNLAGWIYIRINQYILGVPMVVELHRVHEAETSEDSAERVERLQKSTVGMYPSSIGHQCVGKRTLGMMWNQNMSL